MRVLVTGSAGFIGRHLVETLRADGVSCYELKNRKDCDLNNCEAVAERVRPLCPQVVVHLAASPDPGKRDDLYISSTENTISCARNVVQALATNPECIFIHVGSYKQYGSVTLPISENSAPRPSTPYGVAKHVSERIAVRHQNARFRVVCLRFGPIYGPLQERKYLVPRLIDSVLHDSPVSLICEEALWDGLYITDAVNAIRLTMTSSSALGRTINISNGTAHPLRNVLDRVVALLRSPSKEHQPRRSSSINVPAVADTSLARSLLGWQPAIDLDTGLRRCIEYFTKASVPALSCRSQGGGD